jgi:hypothetical protein
MRSLQTSQSCVRRFADRLPVPRAQEFLDAERWVFRNGDPVVGVSGGPRPEHRSGARRWLQQSDPSRPGSRGVEAAIGSAVYWSERPLPGPGAV